MQILVWLLLEFGVSLLENGGIIAYRNYSESGNWEELFGEIYFDGLEIGEDIEKRITIKNSGNISEFVRIIITKYWADKDGNKIENKNGGVDIDELIELNFTGDENWLIDEARTTTERTLAYYKKAIDVREETGALIDSIKISPDIYDYGYTISEDENGNITVNYDINGLRMGIEVDAVQTHNAKVAIKSAWGIDVEISEDESTILEIY